jgi:hypothetical protein
MRRAWFVLALILPTLGACGDVFFAGPDDIFLRVDRTQYAAGDTAILRLVNESGETIGYNLCVHLVQRQTADGWVDTLYGHESLCPLPRYELRHDDSDTYPAPLDAATPPGTYRFRTRVDSGDEGEFSVYSRSFEVDQT